MAEDLKTEVKGMVLAVRDLPTLPTVLEEVSKLVENPDVSTDKIGKVISTDQVLTAKVLKMVNSPIYGFPGRISAINHALVLLGFNVIRGIIISTSVFDIMNQNMKGLWEHSLGCATAANTIARHADLDGPEEYSVSGLLHDLGKVVTAVQLPQMHTAIQEKVKEKDVTWLEAEKLVLGFGHNRINAWLADHWHLPNNIKEGMAYHHAPHLASNYPAMAATVHLADFLVKLYEYGFSGDDQVPPFNPEALTILKLRTSDLEKILDDLSDKFVEISDLSFEQ